MAYATPDKQTAETKAEELRKAQPDKVFEVAVYDRGIQRGWRTMVPRTWGIVQHQIGFIPVF